MASKKVMIIVWALTTLLVRLAISTDHTIGGPSGWTITTDAQTWAASQTFSVGDNLLFAYPTAFHNVIEVSKPEFDNCQATRPLATFSNGNTVVPLNSPGKRYFICGTPGHCKQGMKLEINVQAAAKAAIPAAPEASPRSQPLAPSLPNDGISPLAPIAPPPSTLSPSTSPSSALPSALSPEPLLPISPGVLPALSPRASPPAPKVSSSLPLIPTAQPPETSPATSSLPLAPGGSVTSNGGSSKTVGNLPAGGTAAGTNNLGTSQTPVDSSASASKTFVLGFGFVLVMMFHMF